MRRIYAEAAETPSAKIRLLNDYWLALAAGRLAPRKSEIDPARIKQLLPYLIITQITLDPLRIFYRLIGTRVAQVWQVDWTGRYMHEGPWTVEEVSGDEAVYMELLQHRAPIFGTESMTWPWHDSTKMRLPYHWAYFPLSEDGEAITHCLTIEDTQDIDMDAYIRPAAVQPVR